MSYSTYDSNDVIDLEHVFDEDRMTHYSSSSNHHYNSNHHGFKPHRISLQSVGDDEIKNLHRSLITPLPPQSRSYKGYPDEEEEQDDAWYHYPSRPDSRTESVMLFKNINNGNEPVTIDFVSSDLNDFMDPYNEDDLMSRPPSRMPHKRRDSLNGFLKTSFIERPSFANPRSRERTTHSLYQTNKEDEERRRDPLHAKSYTESSVLQKRESKKDNYHMELRSLKASVNNLILASSTNEREEDDDSNDHHHLMESQKAIENDVIRKRLETRRNPEKLRKRYSLNVDQSNVPAEPIVRRRVNNNNNKHQSDASRRWSSYIPEQDHDNVNSLSVLDKRRTTILQKKKSAVDLNYPSKMISEPRDDELWESQVSDPPPIIKKSSQRPVRITSLHYRTDNIKQPTTTTTTRYRKYSDPSKIDDYNKRPTNNVTITSIPKGTSKLYELATQREPKQQQQQQQKGYHSKIITPSAIVTSRSSGELSNSTESSSNSGDLYYDTPPSPPSGTTRTRELSNRQRPTFVEPKNNNNRTYRIRTLSEEERMPTRNSIRSKKLSLDSQKPTSSSSVAENARQVLEMVRQRRQQAMSSRTH